MKETIWIPYEEWILMKELQDKAIKEIMEKVAKETWEKNPLNKNKNED